MNKAILAIQYVTNTQLLGLSPSYIKGETAMALIAVNVRNQFAATLKQPFGAMLSQK